jgi:CubicO group peptidase (beta-lactamase class C family)
MMRITNRSIRQARATPVRGRRTIIRPRWRRTPIAALVLTMLALFAPELLLAPTVAGEGRGPVTSAAKPVGPAGVLPMHVLPLDFEDRRAGSGFVPAPQLPAPRPTVPAPAPAAVDTTAWVRALDAARAQGKAHGISFAAVRDGEVVWAGSSGRARDGRTGLAADTPMVIGSVTKTFVAAAVLQLAEEGTLSLDDPVRDHLPELTDLSGEITLRQLLDHTSGLADLFNDTTRRGLEQQPDHAWTADEVLDTLHAPWYQPGEGWAYANTNYYLLGMIIERVTGASLADVLDGRFFDPLGLAGTRLLTGAEGDPLEPAWTTIFWASGAMASPAADLARWGDAVYGGELLSAATRTSMLKMNDHDYGLGVQEIEVGKVKGHGHTGLLNTYTTLLFHVPAEDVTVALLVNRSHVDLAAMLRADPGDGPSLLELALDR